MRWKRAIPRLSGALGGSVVCALLASSAAFGATPHTVQPGETLWSIATASGLTTSSVAAFNGMSETDLLVAGTTIYVPTVAEGAAAVPSATAAPGMGSVPPGMGYVESPYGPLPLAPAAADAWNRMRAEALSSYGIDIYPGGPLSAYRTYEQQAQLYEAFLAGYGAPANPPGMSSHETGTAVDVETPDMRWVIDQLGWKYGWTKVHGPSEWWHVDYVGG
jgi:LAS superfamily LD-carboxypeptidase LdcB